ncbi:amino acid permease [Mycetocola spongiae]|uniref:amino acid permease n=1 Tax=Mycetocola spongiae TaxID=2859226 RepID=UPI001CF15AE5|nr:amino acid permease [Mycetocola spongiae]UCR90051.1 amino acid permease [Mycetocola spongiae]
MGTLRGSFFRVKSIEASIADTESEERSLKRTLRTRDLMVMGVAVAVGAGIFSVGAKAAGQFAGPSVTLAFVLAALTCALAIMCYAEFSSAVPVAGSAYTFTYASLGELAAWIIGWDILLELAMAGSVIAKYWGIYLAEVFRILGVDIPSEINVLGIGVSWASMLIVVAFTIMLCLGTKLSARVNGVLTVVKVATVLFVVIVGAFFIKLANFSPFIPPARPAPAEGSAGDQSLLAMMAGLEPTQYGVFGLLSAAALVFFAFIGFDVVASSSEEVVNPQKTIPRGIFGGLAIVTFLYLAVTLVITGMVPYTTLAAEPEPSLATAFIAAGLPWAAQIISISILLGLSTVVLVLLMGLARIVFAMSRDGLLPRSWSKTSPTRKTPIRIQIGGGIVVALVAGVVNVDALTEMINIGTLSAFVLVSISVVVLRRKRPDLKRDFRVPWSPFLPLLSAVLCLILMLNLSINTWLRFAVWLVVGLIVYLSYGRRHSMLAAQTPKD